MPQDQVAGFGLVRVDDSGRVIGFVEKPKRDDQLPPFETPASYIESQGVPFNDRPYLASMGIYLFSRDTLVNCSRRSRRPPTSARTSSRGSSTGCTCRRTCSTATGRTWAR